MTLCPLFHTVLFRLRVEWVHCNECVTRKVRWEREKDRQRGGEGGGGEGTREGGGGRKGGREGGRERERGGGARLLLYLRTESLTCKYTHAHTHTHTDQISYARQQSRQEGQ